MDSVVQPALKLRLKLDYYNTHPSHHVHFQGFLCPSNFRHVMLMEQKKEELNC